MEWLVLLLVVLSSCLSLLAVLVQFREQMRTRAYRRQEAAAARGMEEEELRRSLAMDEGVDNLMRFSVNGHDGFGGSA
jgi:hypothetical protein